jgi:hypothetical protein
MSDIDLKVDENTELIGQRLMAEMRHMSVEVKVAADIMAEIERENEKLREILRELYEDAFLEYPSHFAEKYQSRLVELGVEVDPECMMESEDA